MTVYGGKAEVTAAVAALLRERFPETLGELVPAASLVSLGLDSVDVLDALAGLERHFSILLEQDDLEDLESFSDLVDLVCRKIGLPEGT